MSVRDLGFRIRLSRDSNFTLDVDGQIPLHGITGIVGASGSGKTTFLRVLAGLERPASARIRFGDTNWSGEGRFLPPEERRVGFVFQSPSLFPHLTVEQNLAFGAKRREVTRIEAIVDALDLGPLMRRSVNNLSGGEARRVALGRALASDPQVLFLDEPLSGLDSARRFELLPYIGRAVAEAQVPALYVTHSMDEITALADRVLGMAGGRLTGWRTPPARLAATVTSVTDGLMRVLIDGADIGQGADMTLPLIARVGEKVGLGLPLESVMISAAPPENSDALLKLPATVIGNVPVLNLSIFGQNIVVPRSASHPIGAAVHLSILRVLPRPEVIDSPSFG